MTSPIRLQPTLTCDAAQSLVAAALVHAKENGWAVAAVVLDPSGHVIASARMDGVSVLVLDIASDKALTAVLGRSTKAYFERMSSDPMLAMGAANRPRMCAWEGGLPIVVDGQQIGAIGISGATGEEDAACAEAALQQVLSS